MIKYYALSLTLLAFFNLNAQKVSPLVDTVIVGPPKYQSEVIQIFKKYDKGLSGSNIDQQLREMESILKRFIDIKRVTAVYNNYDGNKKETIYAVSFEGKVSDMKKGEVMWSIKTDLFDSFMIYSTK